MTAVPLKGAPFNPEEVARSGLDRAQGHTPPEKPRPLMRELPKPDPYPIDALGRVLAEAAAAINDKVEAPLAICGNAVLGAAALAVQGHADIVLPFGQSRPISLYLLTVAASSERKSTADAEALWPIRQHERNLRELHDTELPGYQNDRLAWERAREAMVKKGKGDRAVIKAGLDALGPPPIAPLSPMLTVTEPTFEGLAKFFANGAAPSLGIYSAEGGQFIGGHGMSPDNKARTAAGLSEVWDGAPIRRLRAGDGASFLPGRRLSLHLMAQPDIAATMLNDRMLLDQGLLSRLLLTAPETLAGSRFGRGGSSLCEAAIKRYGARLLEILETPLPIAQGRPHELDPRHLTLTADAAKAFYQFSDHAERQMAPGGDLADYRGLAGKMSEHAARIAAVLVLVENPAALEVSASFMRAGIALAEHHLSEALRLFGASRVHADLRQAQTLLTWLQTGWAEPAVSLPDVYQRGPNGIRDKATAKKLVDILEDHGWLRGLPEGAIVAGQRRRDAWAIIPIEMG